MGSRGTPQQMCGPLGRAHGEASTFRDERRPIRSVPRGTFEWGGRRSSELRQRRPAGGFAGDSPADVRVTGARTCPCAGHWGAHTARRPRIETNADQSGRSRVGLSKGVASVQVSGDRRGQQVGSRGTPQQICGSLGRTHGEAATVRGECHQSGVLQRGTGHGDGVLSDEAAQGGAARDTGHAEGACVAKVRVLQEVPRTQWVKVIRAQRAPLCR